MHSERAKKLFSDIVVAAKSIGDWIDQLLIRIDGEAELEIIRYAA